VKTLVFLVSLVLALGACSLFDKDKKTGKKKDTTAEEPTAPLNPPPPPPPPPPPVTTFGKDLGAAAVALSLKEMGASAKLYADCAERKIPRTGCYQIVAGDAVNATAAAKPGTPEEPKITDPE